MKACVGKWLGEGFEKTAVGGHAQIVDSVDLRDHFNQVNNAFSYQRFAAGYPHFIDAKFYGGFGDINNFIKR